MIAASLSTEAVAASLTSLGPKAEAAAEIAATDLTAQLLAIAQRNLSGAVLNARSGALRASLAASVDPGANLRATITASTPYAALQEYGFTGIENVRGRRRDFTRHVDYPAHSYLRSALAALAPRLEAALANATAKALAP